MRILYDSKNELYKSPFGVLKEGQSCTLNIKIPTNTMPTSVKAVFSLDGKDEREFGFYLHECKDGYNTFRCIFTLEERGLYFYKFKIETNNGSFYLFKHAESDTNIGQGALWQLSVIPRDFSINQEFQGAVMYQIFPDRFAKDGNCDLGGKLEPYSIHTDMYDTPCYWPNEHGEVMNCDFFGGNLRGIISKLDYLSELSVNVIYLNPIFKAFSNHRYDTADYMQIDPMLGTEQDFIDLCNAAHERGIKIILDGVFSHTGSNSIYFDAKHVFGNGAVSNPNSPYRSWFDFQSYPDVYTSWWGIKTLPCTKETEPSYMDYIIYNEDSVIAHWMNLGADGYRLDVADELPDSFILALSKRVKEINPDALVIGEVWEDASNKESYGVRRRYFVDGELQSVMNYPWRHALINFACEYDDGKGFREAVMTIAENYPEQTVAALMNILSTHDTPRILTILGDRFEGTKQEKENRYLSPEALSQARQRLMLASFLQYTLPGMPCIYYGDEIGMQGFEDPLNRRFFLWELMDVGMRLHYTELGKIKNSYKALRSGKISFVHAGDGMLHFVRPGKKNLHIIASNSIEHRDILSPGKPIYSHNVEYNNGSLTLWQYGFAIIEE
jgi:cyclomaltodextrinase